MEGLLAAARSETFTFFLIAEGDATLTVAGRQVRMAPSASGPMFEVTLTVPLTAERRVPVRIDYAPSGPAATAALQLRWKSASTPKGAISSCRLYPPP